MSECDVCGEITRPGSQIARGYALGFFEHHSGPPYEAASLEALPGNVFRCPACGTYYWLEEEFKSFLENDYSFVRMGPLGSDGPDATRVRVHDAVRAKDVAALERLIRAAERETKQVAIQTIDTYIDESSVERSLREFLRELRDSSTEKPRC